MLFEETPMNESSMVARRPVETLKSDDYPASRPAAARSQRLEAVRRACRYIERKIASEDEAGDPGPVTLAELGRECAISPWHLQRLFKQAMGVTPRQYADACRVDRLKTGLQQGAGVAAATYDAGFGSASRVYERAPQALGMTPASYAKGGEGVEIAYATANSPLGRLLVAATDKGICFVSIGKGDGPLIEALSKEFPAARRIRRDNQALSTALAAILAHLEGRAPHIDLPLDIRATAFQQRVWEELRRIPLGETLTYGEIAGRLGQPGGARAVGRACATNPVAIVIPCHRACGADGSLTGYRWGKGVKQELLTREAAKADIHRK
jgi:AraC family transcriptional regulator of adaptative response/methylated-DNA-[protein]-cysteine methyltransferase